jgi:hypothetical protein
LLRVGNRNFMRLYWSIFDSPMDAQFLCQRTHIRLTRLSTASSWIVRRAPLGRNFGRSSNRSIHGVNLRPITAQSLCNAKGQPNVLNLRREAPACRFAGSTQLSALNLSFDGQPDHVALARRAIALSMAFDRQALRDRAAGACRIASNSR